MREFNCLYLNIIQNLINQHFHQDGRIAATFMIGATTDLSKGTIEFFRLRVNSQSEPFESKAISLSF
jgi:hypothetical protein